MQIDVEALVGDAHAEWGESRENWRNGYRIGTGTPAAAPSRCASQSCGEAAPTLSSRSVFANTAVRHRGSASARKARTAPNALLLDHLTRAQQQRLRDRQPQRLDGLEIGVWPRTVIFN
jgi:hypothetical protein